MRVPKPQLSPLDVIRNEAIGEGIEMLGNDNLLGRINLKKYIYSFILLYALSAFIQWMYATNVWNTVIDAFRVVSMFGCIAYIPYQLWFPDDVLAKRVSDNSYKYPEQLLTLISHSMMHFAAYEIFTSSTIGKYNNLLALSMLSFWCIWSHFLLQWSRMKISQERGSDELRALSKMAIASSKVSCMIETIVLIFSHTMLPLYSYPIIQVLLIVFYVTSCIQFARHMQLSHLLPYIVLFVWQFVIQLLIALLPKLGKAVESFHSSTYAAADMRQRYLLPGGLMVVLTLASFVRDVKLKYNDNVSGKQQAKVAKAEIMFTGSMIVISMIFIYSRHNLYYMIIAPLMFVLTMSDLATVKTNSKIVGLAKYFTSS